MLLEQILHPRRIPGAEDDRSSAAPRAARESSGRIVISTKNMPGITGVEFLAR